MTLPYIDSLFQQENCFSFRSFSKLFRNLGKLTKLVFIFTLAIKVNQNYEQQKKNKKQKKKKHTLPKTYESTRKLMIRLNGIL